MKKIGLMKATFFLLPSFQEHGQSAFQYISCQRLLENDYRLRLFWSWNQLAIFFFLLSADTGKYTCYTELTISKIIWEFITHAKNCPSQTVPQSRENCLDPGFSECNTMAHSLIMNGFRIGKRSLGYWISCFLSIKLSVTCNVLLFGMVFISTSHSTFNFFYTGLTKVQFKRYFL